MEDFIIKYIDTFNVNNNTTFNKFKQLINLNKIKLNKNIIVNQDIVKKSINIFKFNNNMG